MEERCSPGEKDVLRGEPAGYTSGRLRAMVGRIEWHMIPDPATAANALVAGGTRLLGSARVCDRRHTLRATAAINVLDHQADIA